MDSCLEVPSEICRSPAALGLDCSCHRPAQSTPKSEQREPFGSVRGWKCGSCPDSPSQCPQQRSLCGTQRWFMAQAVPNPVPGSKRPVQAAGPSPSSGCTAHPCGAPALSCDRQLCPQPILHTGKHKGRGLRLREAAWPEHSHVPGSQTCLGAPSLQHPQSKEGLCPSPLCCASCWWLQMTAQSGSPLPSNALMSQDSDEFGEAQQETPLGFQRER